MSMGRPKGSGYIEKRKKGRRWQYRARRTVKGKVIVGDWRDGYEQAEDDRKGLSPATGDYSLSLEQFLAFCIEKRYPKVMQPESVKTQASVLRTHLHGTPLGRTALQSVTPEQFQDFLDAIEGSPHLVKKVGSVVSRAYAEARLMRVHRQNPCDGAVYPRIKRRRNHVLQAGDLTLFADPSSLFESMLVVSLQTLMRRTEVCRLQRTEIVGETILLDSDKGDTAKAIPMTPQVSQIVAAQPRRGKYVFTREDGSPPDPDWYTKQWKRWRDEHGLDPRVRLHDLRGTGITILLADGHDIKTVQAIARHADAKTTLNIYAQVVESNKKAAVSALQKHTSKAHQSRGRGAKKA